MSNTHQHSTESKQTFEKWKSQAEKMVEWYKGRSLPEGSFRLNSYSTITDAKKFVETNISMMLSNMSKPWQSAFKPAYMRLYELKKHIENEQH